MKLTRSLLLSLPAFAICFAGSSFAADLTEEFDAKHKECLERIAQDNQLAFEAVSYTHLTLPTILLV